jgi:hypothetical protein
VKRLPLPEDVYTEVWSKLSTGRERLSSKQAVQRLDRYFTGPTDPPAPVAAAEPPRSSTSAGKAAATTTSARQAAGASEAAQRPMVVLLVDEIDYLLTPKLMVPFSTPLPSTVSPPSASSPHLLRRLSSCVENTNDCTGFVV